MKSDKNEHQSSSETPASLIAATLNGPMGRSVSIIEKSVRNFQQEGFRFLNRRLEENQKIVSELASCRELPQVLAVQQKWFADLTRAYSEEWVRYGDLIKDALEAEEDAAEGEARRSRHSSRRN